MLAQLFLSSLNCYNYISLMSLEPPQLAKSHASFNYMFSIFNKAGSFVMDGHYSHEEVSIHVHVHVETYYTIDTMDIHVHSIQYMYMGLLSLNFFVCVCAICTCTIIEMVSCDVVAYDIHVQCTLFHCISYIFVYTYFMICLL